MSVVFTWMAPAVWIERVAGSFQAGENAIEGRQISQTSDDPCAVSNEVSRSIATYLVGTQTERSDLQWAQELNGNGPSSCPNIRQTKGRWHDPKMT